MNKIPCVSQNICIFGQLSPAVVHSADCWFESEVVDPYFIHCHIFLQKLLFVALKQLLTTLWIVDVLLFFIDCGNPISRVFWGNGLSIIYGDCTHCIKVVNAIKLKIFNYKKKQVFFSVGLDAILFSPLLWCSDYHSGFHHMCCLYSPTI